MKNLILPFLLVFATTFGYAQAIPEKANAIIITQPDSIGLSEKVTKVLSSKDYSVVKGKNPSVLTTAARTLKNGTRLSFNVQLKGPEIILTGKILVAGQTNMTIENNGKKGTPFMNGWEEMDKIAKALGGKVRYEIK